MSLKAKLSTADFEALDESLRQFYRQSGDTFLLDAEGVEDVTGLKKTLEDLRAKRDKANQRLQEFEKLNAAPEEIIEALEDRRQRLEKKLIDANDFEGLFKARMDPIVKAKDAEIAALQRAIQEEQQRTGTLTSSLHTVVVENGITQAAQKVGVRPTAVRDVLSRARDVWKVDDGKPTPYGPDGNVLYGKNGTPVSMDEWVASLATEASHLFEASAGGGSDAGAKARTLSGKVVLTADQARDPRLYRAAKEQALKANTELVIQK